MRTSRLLLTTAAFSISIFLAACATGYHPKGLFGDGFAEQSLGADQWLVTFDASTFTPREQVDNYLLLRCAEIAAGNGANYFVLVDEGTGAPAVMIRPTLIDMAPFAVDAQAREPRSESIRSARAFMRVYKARPEGADTIYDAREVIARLASERHG